MTELNTDVESRKEVHAMSRVHGTTSPPNKPQTVPAPDQIEELTRQRAYELYVQRGREDGHDFDDWITAEMEVTRQSKAVAA
jgi:hypothetical protein